MSKEIDYSNLVYHFKGLTYPINFAIFGGPVYTYDQLKQVEKVEKQQAEKQQKDVKKELNNFRKSKAWK